MLGGSLPSWSFGVKSAYSPLAMRLESCIAPFAELGAVLRKWLVLRVGVRVGWTLLVSGERGVK